MIPNYFLDMIRHLRRHEEVILHNRILTISEAHGRETVDFLAEEYKNEATGYPHQPPPFDAEAAVWSAKTIYTAMQLMLYRDHKEADLAALLPDLTNYPSPSQQLSADLCLRFLPDVLKELKLIDSEDQLIALLEAKLAGWHFSGVNYCLDTEKISFDIIVQNPCLHQLYADRILQYKNTTLARHPAFQSMIAGALGMYSQNFWKEFKTETL